MRIHLVTGATGRIGAWTVAERRHATTIGEIVETIAEAVPENAGAITYEETPLPFPSGLDSSSFVELVGEKPGDSARRRRARDRASLP